MNYIIINKTEKNLIISFLPYIIALSMIDKVSYGNGYEIYTVAAYILSPISFFYQMVYLFKLRKENNTSFKKALAQIILYISFCIETLIIIFCIDAHFNGVWVGIFSYDTKIYGFDAWLNVLTMYIVLPIFIICTIYQFIYFGIINKKGRNK